MLEQDLNHGFLDSGLLCQLNLLRSGQFCRPKQTIFLKNNRNTIGVFFPNSTHNEIAKTKIHKNKLEFDNSASKISMLNNFDINNLDQNSARKLNEAFAESLVLYWPRNKNFFSPFEDWIMYAIQKVEHHIAPFVFFTNLERHKWRKIIQSGYGLCSQQTLAMYDFFKTRHII